MISNIVVKFRNTKLVVHLLVCVFAIASWANMNGMWVELPLLVMELPEKWTLPSYITIISQVANIGPLLFVLITFLIPRTKGKIEIYASGVIIILSMVTCFFLAFLWDKTSYVGGSNHSTAFLTLNFFMAFGDCISSVSFYAFMAMMKPEYIATLFLGESFSGMLPAMIALGQGAGGIVCVNTSSTHNATYPNGTEYNKTTWNVYPNYTTPKFTVKIYFILLSFILAISFIAFLLLNVWKYCRTEFISGAISGYERIISSSSQSKDYGSSVTVSKEKGVASSDQDLTYMQLAVNWKFLCFQGIIVLINMTRTTFLSAIQIYSTLPYGLEAYHLVTTLTNIASPLACILALFFMVQDLLITSVITFLGEVGVAYIIYMAAKSPHPPLHGEDAGAAVTVLVWIVMTFLLAYAKVCVAGAMRVLGRRSLITTGVSTQVGSFIGAIVGFILVSKYHMFKSAPYC